MAENNSSAPLKTAEGEYPAPLIDGAWYWVRYFGLFKETEAPAQYKEACCAFYSVSFSGVPVAEVEILAPLAVEAQAPAAVAVPEFDEWITREYPHLGPIGDGVNIAREAWHAGRASLAATPALPATKDSSAGDLATESVLIEGVAYTIPEPVALELLRLNIELQLAEVQAEPVANCYSDDDGDTWRDCPDDSDFMEGRQLGEEFELQASIRSWSETFRVTKVPDETSDDYEVEPVSVRTAPQAQPAAALDAKRLDFLETQRHRKARDGGYSAFYSVYLPAMAVGPWQATHGGEYDHKSLREAIDAAMAAVQERGRAVKAKKVENAKDDLSQQQP